MAMLRMPNKRLNTLIFFHEITRADTCGRSSYPLTMTEYPSLTGVARRLGAAAIILLLGVAVAYATPTEAVDFSLEPFTDTEAVEARNARLASLALLLLTNAVVALIGASLLPGVSSFKKTLGFAALALATAAAASAAITGQPVVLVAGALVSALAVTVSRFGEQREIGAWRPSCAR